MWLERVNRECATASATGAPLGAAQPAAPWQTDVQGVVKNEMAQSRGLEPTSIGFLECCS